MSCSNNENKLYFSNKYNFQTEKQRREYFQDSIAFRSLGYKSELENSTDYYAFLNRNQQINEVLNGYNDSFITLLYALDEDFAIKEKLAKNEDWIRFTVRPCFRYPYCLKIVRKNNRTYMTAKSTNGNGCYFSGILDFELTKTFHDSLFQNITKQLQYLNFNELSDDTSCVKGWDGENWLIEACISKKYNKIKRWSPLECGDSITKQIAEIGLHCFNLMKFKLDSLQNRRFNVSMEKLIEMSKGKL